MMKGESRWRYRVQANQFLTTSQGQWALRHGCGVALWEHVAEFSSYPSRSEIQRIYDSVQRNMATFSQEYGSGPMVALAKFWQARMAREQQLAQQFLQPSAA